MYDALIFAYHKSSHFVPALVTEGVLGGVVQQIQLEIQYVLALGLSSLEFPWGVFGRDRMFFYYVFMVTKMHSARTCSQ
jgi:hypothetical protein